MDLKKLFASAGEVVAWIINPMSRPWSEDASRGTRIAGEAVGVALLPLLFNWLRENILNVTVTQSNIIVFLGELGLPLIAAVLIGFLPAFREMDAYQASLVGLWIQRALTVHLILLSLWAGILINRGVQLPDPGSVPFWFSYYFAYWVAGGVVAALAGRAMRSGDDPAPWSEVFLAVGLYLVVIAVLRFARIPDIGHPWFAADLP